MVLSDQLVTLAAVVVGAGMTYLTTKASERSQFNREMKIRWDQRRLEVYASYAMNVKLVEVLAKRAFAARSGRDPDYRSFEQLFRDVREVEERRSTLFEQVMLIGDPLTIEAAHELNQCLWRLEGAATKEQLIDPDQWDEWSRDYVSALNAFHGRARTALEVNSPSSP